MVLCQVALSISPLTTCSLTSFFSLQSAKTEFYRVKYDHGGDVSSPCHILLVRSKSSVLLTLKGRGLRKGVDTGRQDVTGGHLRVCPSPETEKPTSWSLVIQSSGKRAQNLTHLCSSLVVVAFCTDAHMCAHTCAPMPPGTWHHHQRFP